MLLIGELLTITIRRSDGAVVANSSLINVSRVQFMAPLMRIYGLPDPRGRVSNEISIGCIT